MTVPLELLELAVSAALDAGELLLSRFGDAAVGLGTKTTPTDPVSDADRDAEERIVSRLRAERPDDAVLAEERGEDAGPSGLRWIVDPLDGTVNFLFGIPQWCVSIACEDADGVLVAVVHDPCRSETFTAVRGGGARLGSEAIEVAEASVLSRSLVATGFAYDAAVRAEQAKLLARVLPRVRDVRRFGSAALDLAWTAGGRFDGFYEAGLGRWDEAAGRLLVTEAGGICSGFSGAGGRGVIASAPGIHEALRAVVTGSAGDVTG